MSERNSDLRQDARNVSFKRLIKFLQRRNCVEDLEIKSPLHFGCISHVQLACTNTQKNTLHTYTSTKDCLQLLSACKFSKVHMFPFASNTNSRVVDRKGLSIDELKRKFVLARFLFTPTKWASNAASISCATSSANSRTQETNCAAVPSLWRRRSVCVSIDVVQKNHFLPHFIHTLMCAGDRFAETGHAHRPHSQSRSIRGRGDYTRSHYCEAPSKVCIFS